MIIDLPSLRTRELLTFLSGSPSQPAERWPFLAQPIGPKRQRYTLFVRQKRRWPEDQSVGKSNDPFGQERLSWSVSRGLRSVATWRRETPRFA